VNESSLAAAQPMQSGKNRIWPMYRAVVGVGVACALIIVFFYEVTRPVIARNLAELRRQAIFDVLPGARRSAAFRLNQNGAFESAAAEDKGELVFAGYDENDALVGLAFETQGMGYQDTIRLIYGYSLEKQAVIGIRVLESRETPGLGDRIESDGQFLKNFDELDVGVDASGDKLAHLIEFVKPGQKTAAWQIDGISGATISSRATAKMLSESTSVWIPRVWAHKEDFLSNQQEQ
jgi:electron transport complex protein RnfG